jgi:uncharacterized RDD family membrane protein YckC
VSRSSVVCGSPLAFGSSFCDAYRSVQSPGVFVSDEVPDQTVVAVPRLAPLPRGAARVEARGSGSIAIAERPLAGRTPARPARRVGAFLIDGACGALVVLIATAVLHTQSNLDILSGSSALTGAAITAMFGPLVIWALGGFLMVIVEGATGATIGNAALRIRTVSGTTGKPPGFGKAFGRRFVEQLGSLVILGAPVIAASSTWDPTQLRQGWQDKAAGKTMVEVGPRAATSGALAARSFAGGAPTSLSPSTPGRQQHPVAPQPPPPVADPPEPRTRRAVALITNVPDFEPQVEPVVPITTPELAPVPADDLDEDHQDNGLRS